MDRARRIRLVFPALCACLGTWQLYRLQWKRSLLASIEQGLAQDPITIDTIPDDSSLLAHRRLRLRGFIHDPDEEPILIGPRSAHSALPSGGFGSMLIRKIQDKQGRSYLLNDGWIPWKSGGYTDSTSGLEGVEVVLDRTERPSLLADKNVPEEGKWRWKDVPQLATQMNTAPIILKRISEHSGQYPVPASATFDIPNRHLEYVLTWYGLSAATLALSFLRR